MRREWRWRYLRSANDHRCAWTLCYALSATAPALLLGQSEGVLRAINVFEALQRLWAQREAQARSVRRVYGPVRPDVERLVEQFPHHRHIALAHLQDVTVGRGHGHVDAGGE